MAAIFLNDPTELLKLSLSLSAFGLSIHTALRSIRSDRLRLFLDLHNRFQTVYAHLPVNYERRDWSAWSDEEKVAGRQCWQASRAEWLASAKWGDRLQRSLWKSHYAAVQVTASEYPGLRSALMELVEGRAPLWRDYLGDLNKARLGAGLPSIN